MSIESVKDEIKEEAEQKAERIKSEAEEKKKEILEEAERKSEQIVEQKEEEAREEASRIEQKKISKAQMEAERTIMNAKNQKVEEVFDSFEQEISDKARSNPQRFFNACRERCGFEPETVEAPEEFEDVVEDLNFEGSDIDGIVFKRNDGSVSQSFTSEKIIEEIKSNKRRRVRQILFE